MTKLNKARQELLENWLKNNFKEIYKENGNLIFVDIFEEIKLKKKIIGYLESKNIDIFNSDLKTIKEAINNLKKENLNNVAESKVKSFFD